MKQRRIITCIALLALPCLMAADDRDAAQSVHEGLNHFEQGQFEEAARAFEKADEVVPNDARIAFNLGCAAAAAGDAAGAVGHFQQAAASTDPKLAAAARYCLGCLAVIEAKTALGEKAAEATPEVRNAALEHLARAVEHYRDAIKLDATNEDTRYNMETIRHWTKHMQELWRQSDRKKMRDGMQLVDYVLLLEKEQREIRTLSKTLGKQADTPLLREQLDEVREAQKNLSEEIEPLKEKVIAALTKPQGGQPGPDGTGGKMMPGGPGGQMMPGGAAQPVVPTADVQKAVALLGGLADQARTEMTTAADLLVSARTPDALKAQAAAVEMLDQIYMAMVPYPGLVKRAVDTQRELVGRTKRVVEPSKAAGPQTKVDKSQKTPDEKMPDDETLAEEQPEIDLHEDAWDQRFVTRWSEVMVAKAKQGLKQMPPAEEKKDAAKKDDAKPEKPTDDKSKDAAKPASGLKDSKQASGEKPDPAAAAKKKMEGLRKSMELAVKLGPQVETLTDEAATHLDEEQPVPALPKQKEALRLLEEIAKPLQDENNKDQQQKQDQKQQDNKDNKEQKNKDQQNKDQKAKKDDQKKDGKDKKEQDKKKDGDKKDKDKPEKKKPEEKKSAGEPKQKKAKTPDQKKAEAALRRARARQQERREMEKAIEAQLYRSGTVEKDW